MFPCQVSADYMTRPFVMVRPQVKDLIEIYCGSGFPCQELVQGFA